MSTPNDGLGASGPDDDTRSLEGHASKEVPEGSPAEDTRELDTPALFESRESEGRRASITDRGASDDHGLAGAVAGETIGRFVILGTLGRGGMGTVHEAFDRTLDRRVAVKVLHHDVARDHHERLLREAQALAQLSHPNVVQVYEVGEVEGQSFVAMELVEGQTLRHWLKQEPRPKWRDSVRVYLQAGAGLAAAHEQGLVHCDFKPSNAIVDDKGRVRVLDFGLARMEEDRDDDGLERSLDIPTLNALRSAQRDSRPALTETGAVMGTPAYMPPEQMRGRQVDARGDQFSFCVALYEAAYGQRPFDGDTLPELEAARNAERFVPAPPTTRVPAVLRQALLRGLSADPDQRWPSMQALLDRLAPLCAPRRKQTVIALTLSGSLVLGLGLVGGGLVYQAEAGQRCSGARAELDGIWDDASRQQVEDTILGTDLSYAPDTWERVSAQLDDYAEAWADEHTEACEATSVRQEQSAGVMDLRMACLRERRVALRETVDVLREAGPSRVARAVTLVGSLPELSRCADVDALQSELPEPEDPQVAAQVEALRQELATARALRLAGAYDEALAQAEALVAQAQGIGHEPLLAEVLLERGFVRQDKAQYEDAEHDLEQAYLLATRLEDFAVEAAAVRELALVVGHDQARHETGLQWAKTALALAQGPRAEPWDEASTLGVIGITLLKKGDLEAAFEHHQRALAIFDRAPDVRPLELADLVHNIGNVQLKQGKLDEALTHLRRALGIRQEALGARHPNVAHSLTAIGAALIQQGSLEEALDPLQQALVIREEALGPDHPDVASSLTNIGAILKAQGKSQEALTHFQRALAIQEKALGPRHPRVAYPLNNIGEVLREQEKLDEARTYLERALAITEEAVGPEHPDVASSVTNLGNLLFGQERYDDAERHYHRALGIQQETLPPEHPHIAWSSLGLAKVGLVKGELEAAQAHAERAVSIREGAKMPPELVAEARFVLARVLGERGERARAHALAEQARDGWSKQGADDPQTKEYLAEVEGWLAEHAAP